MRRRHKLRLSARRLSACSRCSTSPGVSSGRRCRTRSGGSSPTSPSSRSASSAMPRPRPLPRSACSAYSRSPSASLPRCMAEGSPPSLPISPISSALNMLAPFTGRLLTAWSTAGIVGPVIVNYMHDTRKAAGVPYDQIYHLIFYVLAGLLVAGFISNLLIRPLDKKWFMSDEEVAALQASLKSRVEAVTSVVGSESFDIRALLAWAAVGIPLAWGIWITLQKAFHLL